MNLTRCENGHFYDADKYPTCPHCADMGGNGPTQAANIGGGVGAMSAAETSDYEVTSGFIPTGQTAGSSPAPEFVVNTPPVDVSYSNPDPVTVPGSNFVTAPAQVPDDDEKTVAFYDTSTGVEPVVGWLVCTKGSFLGKSYNLKAGRNFIGRGRQYDVDLTGDDAVSRSRHAIVLFEPKKREFIAQPGEASGLFYVNDEVVLTATRLKAKDVLSVGNTCLTFVPFCDESFGWDDDK